MQFRQEFARLHIDSFEVVRLQRFKHVLIMALFLFTGYLFLANSEIAKFAVSEGLKLCATAILPALFPFFILSDLWIRSGNAAQIADMFSPVIEKLFHISGNTTPAFLLGLIGGYPIGIRTISQLYLEKFISKDDAEKAMLFCNNAGPAFIIGIVGIHVFHSVNAGILLYVIHVVSAILIGFLLRPKLCAKNQTAIQKPKSIINRTNELTTAITNGGQTALLVCTYVLLFSLIIEIIHAEFSNMIPKTLFVFLSGLIELTNGIHMLAAAGMSESTRFVAASFFLGFGGSCIIMQSLSLISSTGLSTKNILIGKTLHGLCSALLARLLWPVCSFTAVSSFSNITQQSYTRSIILSAIFVPFVFIIFLTKITTGKQKNNRI